MPFIINVATIDRDAASCSFSNPTIGDNTHDVPSFLANTPVDTNHCSVAAVKHDFRCPLHSTSWSFPKDACFCRENERWTFAFCRPHWSGVGSLVADLELYQTYSTLYTGIRSLPAGSTNPLARQESWPPQIFAEGSIIFPGSRFK